MTEETVPNKALSLKFYHLRILRYGEKDFNENRYYATGGATFAYSYIPESKTLMFTKTYCNFNDNYNKKIGRLICKGRFGIPTHTYSGTVEYDKIIPFLRNHYIKDKELYWPDVRIFIE